MTISVDYKVETGVPIPVQRSEPLPLRGLKVGESILFPMKRRTTIMSYASRLKRKEGMQFTTKKVDENSCRIWRVK